jgi:circadian clock protein KaiC
MNEDRMATGIAGLDIILNGGFLRGGIYILQGHPGAGKTILANQVCFAEIAAGRRALYVTLLAESHARMIANLGSLSFFDDRKIPESLYYVSAFGALEQNGLRGLLDVVRREMRNHRASVLIVDGLMAAEMSATSNLEVKKFVQALQTQTEMGACTALLLTSGRSDGQGPERTMVDGLIELADVKFGSVRERRLEVLKFRGGPYLRGPHSFAITGNGLELYPRIETVLPRPQRRDGSSPARVLTGCADFDQILQGGYPLGSTTMVLGPSGAGKTSLGLHFMAPCNKSEPGVYLSFYEGPERAAIKATRLGLPLQRLLDEEAVKFLWIPTTENILDAVAGELLTAVRQHKAKRVFIDGLDGFTQFATDAARVVRVFTALTNEFRSLGATILYTAESHTIVADRLEAPPTGVSTMIDNLVVLRYAELESRLRRLISVLKVRDSDFDPMLREVEFTDAGLVIGNPFVGWENLVGGSTRKQSGSRE